MSDEEVDAFRQQRRKSEGRQPWREVCLLTFTHTSNTILHSHTESYIKFHRSTPYNIALLLHSTQKLPTITHIQFSIALYCTAGQHKFLCTDYSSLEWRVQRRAVRVPRCVRNCPCSQLLHLPWRTVSAPAGEDKDVARS